jgi:hypothetical protein
MCVRNPKPTQKEEKIKVREQMNRSLYTWFIGQKNHGSFLG